MKINYFKVSPFSDLNKKAIIKTIGDWKAINDDNLALKFVILKSISENEPAGKEAYLHFYRTHNGKKVKINTLFKFEQLDPVQARVLYDSAPPQSNHSPEARCSD